MATKISSPIISTLMAELNVVKIGNKQMTISVFNQLYTDKCYDDDFNILYPIWGKVKREEEWIIFQKGNDLRKQRMPSMIKCSQYKDVCKSVIVENKNLILSTETIKKKDEEYKKLNNDRLSITKQIEAMNNQQKFMETNKNYAMLHRILYASYSPQKEELDLALTIIEEKLLNNINDECRNRLAKEKKGYEMMSELHNSKQLFIAI